ncbi:hypothetical protein [Agrobacterium tumefaciens]|uniref:hypothetical protein n=1 Tax=Agrobacterium tumefaciens TaxID=358 RepID=UPI001D764842|nr:hypothetical protein [Agrobacterium tumefaciens]NTB05449.1 hypothetical protein [Agrobacterium tumefaciens]NTE53235.1 hypothetical protein [Agrobacterium tumefaciens]
MSTQKDCADYLRAAYRNMTGEKLRSSHAHELVAAYFGYGTAAALQADVTFPLSSLEEAEILIPDIDGINRRRAELSNVPVELPDGRAIAKIISASLEAAGHFRGEIWDSTYLSDDINDYIQRDPMVIENELAGEIATTNAYFDELYIEETSVETHDDSLIATLSGSLNGEQDQDRAFHGDKIKFTSIMTMRRAASRVGYFEPEFETGGRVDDSMYYDPEWA